MSSFEEIVICAPVLLRGLRQSVRCGGHERYEEAGRAPCPSPHAHLRLVLTAESLLLLPADGPEEAAVTVVAVAVEAHPIVVVA